MSERGSKLEAALAVWVEFQQRGGNRADLLAAHPDLRELLAAFMTDEADGEPGAGAAGGERVLGEYRLGRELGRGGMGVVYEARQITLDRRVAVKVMAPALAARPSTLARFRREALHLARFDHPGILRVFDIGEDDGEHWLAMELVEGESLDRRLDALRAAGGHRGDSLRPLLLVIEQVARALAHAHEHGIVHRDVKPSNVLLRGDGSAVLGDFGLARDEADATLTQAGAVAGTPHYLSPEQVLRRRAQVDGRSDVFALGVTLYECITLRLPFDGATAEQILHRIVHRDPIDPRRLHAGLPADLAAIAERALEKDPDRRYQTAAALADDLRAFLEFRPVQARPLSRAARLRRWARREPLRAALAGAGVLVLALAAWLAFLLPEARAAERARQREAYETEFTAGVLARAGKDKAAAYRHFLRALELQPGRGEAVAGLCLAIHHFEGPAAALAELEKRAGAHGADEDVERIRALVLLRVGRVAESQALAERLGEPRSPTAMWLTAATLTDDQGDKAALAQARDLMSLVVRIAPQPRLLYHAQWAVLESSVGTAESKRESAEALLRLWPEHPLALYVAAVNLMVADPPRSVPLFERALALGLEDPLCRVNLSLTLDRAGRPADAAAQAHRALAQPELARSPFGARGHELLLRLLQRVQDPRAGEAAERWLRQAPDDATALQIVGAHASRAGEHERALQHLRRACELAPAHVDFACDLALALLNAGDAPGALAVLQPLCERAPRHVRLHELLLDALHDLAQPDLPELQRWAAANPEDLTAWTELALRLGQTATEDSAADALAAAERADHLAQGKDPRLLRLRARALEKLGNAAESKRLREKAATLPPAKDDATRR